MESNSLALRALKKMRAKMVRVKDLPIQFCRRFSKAKNHKEAPPCAAVVFPKRKPMMPRGILGSIAKERYMGGHKKRTRNQMWFPQGAGGHDARYKDVRRGCARRGRPSYRTEEM